MLVGYSQRELETLLWWALITLMICFPLYILSHLLKTDHILQITILSELRLKVLTQNVPTVQNVHCLQLKSVLTTTGAQQHTYSQTGSEPRFLLCVYLVSATIHALLASGELIWEVEHIIIHTSAHIHKCMHIVHTPARYHSRTYTQKCIQYIH